MCELLTRDDTSRPQRRYFYCLREGVHQKEYIESVVTAAWLLMGEGYPIIEDFEGAADCSESELIECLKIHFAEFLCEIEHALGGPTRRDPDHDLAVALEEGLHNVMSLTGTEFSQFLELPLQTEPQVYLANIKAIWKQLIHDFPLAVPDPLTSDGQGAVLRVLRVWSKLCDSMGISSEFLIPLMKAV